MEADYSINLDFNALHRGYTLKITRALERAAFALHSVVKAEENPGLMPAGGPANLSIKYEPRPLDEVKPEVSAWIVGNALRDCMEETAAFLEEVRKLCAAVKMSEKQTCFTATEFAETVLAPAKKFEKRGLPDKITFLSDNYGDVLDARIHHVVTLNDARNCLVHRLGIVGPADLKDGRTDLPIRWQRLEFHIKPLDGGESYPMPENGEIPGGGHVMVRRAEVERRLALGERVVISEGDLCSIWMTLNEFGTLTAAKVHAYGTTKGFRAAEASVTPPFEPGHSASNDSSPSSSRS